MQTFFSCFSCGEKPSSVSNPQPILVTPSKIPSQPESSNKKQLTDFDDDKSRSATTITFRTVDTAPSTTEDEQSYIRKKIQQMRKLDLPERKAMESQFIRQNLSRVKTATVYLVEKSWSELYTAYLKNIGQKELRSINNSKLFDSKNNLRNDIKEKEDYFIINDRVWKFVQQMYGGGPGIMQDVYFPVVQITVKKHEVPLVGLVNPLNLCFMIAVMQCLITNQHFSQFMYKRMFEDPKKKFTYHNAIHKVIKAMTQSQPNKMEVKQMAALIQSKFSPFEQHDAHQFFLFLMDILQQESKTQVSIINNAKDKTAQMAYTTYLCTNRSIVDKLFIGQIETALTCTRCEEVSTSYNTIIDLELQIIDIVLEKCLNKHFSMEKIEDYDCEKCKRKTKAFKQYFLTKTPNYLILVLKKFNQNGKKIEERVKYPLELDIKRYKHFYHRITKGHCGDTKYTLQSVLVHKGIKSTKGHYYCYTHRTKKLNSEQKELWQYANDEVCKDLEGQQVLGRDAYMLFYERK